MLRRMEGGPPEPVTTSVNEMLQTLCERQAEEIRRLKADNEDLYNRAVVKGEALTKESAQRVATLEDIRVQVGTMNTRTETVLRQRDMVVKVLRELFHCVTHWNKDTATPDEVKQYKVAVSEAEQLLDSIDNASKKPNG